MDVAHQASLSMGFSRQEHWSGLPFPSPGDLPDPGIEPRSLTLKVNPSSSGPVTQPEVMELQFESQGSGFRTLDCPVCCPCSPVDPLMGIRDILRDKMDSIVPALPEWERQKLYV